MCIYQSVLISMQLSYVDIVYIKINKWQKRVAFINANPVGIGCIVYSLVNFEYTTATISNFLRHL